MEVKLDELITLLAHDQKIPGRIVDLDRVSIVDHVERSGVILKAQRRQRERLGVRSADVDRRLSLSSRASRKIVLQSSPLIRARPTLIAPVRMRLRVGFF